MNRVVLMGRLCKEPDVKYTTGENSFCVARYTLAVDRKFKRDGEPTADFINCVAFRKNGEFAEKYFTKGTKIAVTGSIQTGSYENKNGQKVNPFDVIVDNPECAESKAVADANKKQAEPKPEPKGQEFMNIPDNADDSGLPFNF